MGIDWVALGWIAASLSGMIIAGVGVMEGHADLEALRDIPRNGRWIVATDYRRTQAGRFVICAVWFAFGLPVAFDEMVTSLNAFTAMFISTNAGLAAMAALSLRDRRRVQRYRAHR